MIVEIHILSGSRQGERLELDQLAFRVGSQPGSAVYFDPANDPPAKDRLAEFRFSEDDGWSVCNAGEGELLVDHEPVNGTAHVRSGNVVRLSGLGPDFVFSILSRPKSVPALSGAERTGATQTLRPPAKETVTSAGNAWAVDDGKIVPDVPVTGAGQAATPAAQLALESAPNTGGWKARALVVAGMVLGLIVLLFVLKPAPDQTDAAAPGGETAEPAQVMPAPGPEQQPKEQLLVDKPKPPAPAAVDRPVEPAPDGPPSWSTVLGQVREAVFLVLVEDPTGQASWPVANACAIRNDTLLTSGTAASALVSLQEMKLDNVDLGGREWTVWAQSATGLRCKVTTIHVHQGYEQLPDDAVKAPPDPRMYFDLGLLTVEETLPATLTLVDRSEEGLPVAAVGIPYRSEQVSPFHSYSIRFVEGQVTMFTHLDPRIAESPALLRVTAPIPLPATNGMGPYQIGCPIIDRSGHLVGIYSSSGLTPEMQRANMHYVVETRLVGLWLAGKGLGSWVEPAVTVQPSTHE
ncbi:MAG: hypothetical protein RBS80_28210 [Thermoguttaceae bacterium]|jgi:hypothetical protein|nr:hypothetical protein [Thermoguttaceae bacterium]